MLGTGAACTCWRPTNVSRLGSTRASVTTYLIPAVALGARRRAPRRGRSPCCRSSGRSRPCSGRTSRTGRRVKPGRTSRDRRRCRRTLSTTSRRPRPDSGMLSECRSPSTPSTPSTARRRASASTREKALLVNVASKCGLTPQYPASRSCRRSTADSGFSVVGFPCNQFGGQEPGTAEEIETFCSTTYGVTFPMFEKIDVNGPEPAPDLRRADEGRRRRRAQRRHPLELREVPHRSRRLGRSATAR